MFKSEIITFLNTRMPRDDMPLEEKLKLIHSKGIRKSQRSLAAEFNISVGAVNNIIRKKWRYLEAFEQSPNSTYLKRQKKNGMDELNAAVQSWFETARNKQMPISGPLLQEKARHFARELGMEDFKASNGWLHRFRERNAPTCDLHDGDREQEAITKIRPRSGEKSGDAPSDSPPVKGTFKDAFKAAETLKLFACNCSMDLTNLAYQVETSICDGWLVKK